MITANVRELFDRMLQKPLRILKQKPSLNNEILKQGIQSSDFSLFPLLGKL